MNRCFTGFLNLAELFLRISFENSINSSKKMNKMDKKNGQFQIMDNKKWTNDNNGHIMDKL